MDDIKIKVIDSNKLINAINEGSYDVNLSAVMSLGAVMLNTERQDCHEDFDKCVKPIEKSAKTSEIDSAPKLIGWICPICGRGLSPFTNVCPCKIPKG